MSETKELLKDFVREQKRHLFRKNEIERRMDGLKKYKKDLEKKIQDYSKSLGESFDKKQEKIMEKNKKDQKHMDIAAAKTELIAEKLTARGTDWKGFVKDGIDFLEDKKDEEVDMSDFPEPPSTEDEDKELARHHQVIEDESKYIDDDDDDLMKKIDDVVLTTKED